MVFSKAFPRTTDKSAYPRWEEVYLSDEEELVVDKNCKVENIRLMKECIEDAKKIFKDKNLKDFQSDVINIAISLFEKRASHNVYWKENKAKEKFDELYSEQK
ncbi:MAG: hypothetical protein KJ583_05330 [Nanoarchaeota archaeon]|nr:hypothetical protein [Nanoarchaeota archaeon]MBU1269556.1 hypothetical protein [Nanoarchaeota archaeon]MBU1604712.1 hypothetical protein [Nanoarchaeota archaeon]MBU2443817.1 hypothetical protein [Nanoarchaeota archaeon]